MTLKSSRVILFFNAPQNPGATVSQESLLPGYTITSDTKHFRNADVVLFGLPRLSLPFVIRLHSGLPGLRKRKGQLWVSRTMECDKNWARQRYKPFMRHFDLTITKTIPAH